MLFPEIYKKNLHPESHFRRVRIMLNKIICLFFLLFGMTACRKVPPADDGFVSSIVDQRLQKYVEWQNPCSPDDEILFRINELLQSELTIESAVQIALLNNPDVQAAFEDIGISRADFIQAGLLQNPSFVGLIDFPISKGGTNNEFTLLQSILEFWLIPFREKIASIEWEQAKLRTANTILDLAFDVQETYYRWQSELYTIQILTPILEGALGASGLAESQRNAGNISEFEFQTRINDYFLESLELSASQSEAIRLREKLNKLLGLMCNTPLHISRKLPDMPREDPDLNCLEDIALSQRLDLEIARWEVEHVATTFGIKDWWVYTVPKVGADYQTDTTGVRTLGPSFSFDIPIFNYGQAERERLRALFKQSIDKLYSKEIDVLTSVRAAKDLLAVRRKIVSAYHQELLGLNEEVILSERYYNYMALSIYTFLKSKSDQLIMEISYNKMLRDYWIARVDLDRSLGGHLNLAVTNFYEQGDEECLPQ